MILKNFKIQKELEAYMKVELYRFEELAAQNKLLLNELKRIRLIFNDGEECYTSGKTIVLGWNFPIFTSTNNPNLIYRRAQGVIIHELAHILYTDFDIFSSFFNRAPQRYKKFTKVSKDIFNILEDYRIEYTISEIHNYFKRLFLMVRFHIVKNLINKLESQVINNDYERANFLINSLLVMGFTERPLFTSDRKTNEMIKEVFPSIYQAIRAKDTKEIEMYSDNVMKILQRLNVPEDLIIDLKVDKSAGPLVGKTTPKGSKTPIAGESGEIGSSGGYADEVDVVNDITKRLEEHDEALNKKKLEEMNEEMYQELQKMDEEGVTDQLINGYFNDEKFEEKQNVLIEKEKKKIEDFSRDMPAIHRGLRLVMRNNPDKFTAEDYALNVRSLERQITEIVNQIENLKETIYEEYEYQQRSGSIDTGSLARFIARDDVDIFKSLYPEDELLELEIKVLIDCSGSNSSQVLDNKNNSKLPRYKVNQMMAIYLHEAFKRLGFKHSIWGFHSESVEVISPMITFTECMDKTAGLKLKDINARGSNRDGYHIRLAGKTLDQYAKTERKLLIVISDGQPAANGYGGKTGIEDVIAAQEELKREGIKTIGIFTGHSTENQYFEDMYEHRYFLNNDSINNFPKTFYELLSKEFTTE